jgi:hypothetical protein
MLLFEYLATSLLSYVYIHVSYSANFAHACGWAFVHKAVSPEAKENRLYVGISGKPNSSSLTGCVWASHTTCSEC